MTTNEIAAEHGVTRQTVHSHRKRGIFPKPVEGEGSTRPRFRADEVAAFFAANPPSPGKRTDLAQPDEGAAMPPTDTPTASRAELVDAAAALLLAAITMRDLASAMPKAAFASMPDDIRGRIVRPLYQGAFDALPVDIQAEARALVDADPDVIAARNL